MSNEKFKAVEFMRKARETMTVELEGLSLEEQIARIERHAAPVRKQLEGRRQDEAA